jgi:hypothetical protein
LRGQYKNIVLNIAREIIMRHTVIDFEQKKEEHEVRFNHRTGILTDRNRCKIQKADMNFFSNIEEECKCIELH